MAEKGQAGMLGTRAARIRELLLSENHQVRVQTERLLMEQQFGKPHQAVDLSGDVTTSWAIEPTRPQTREAWLAAHSESQREMAAADMGVDPTEGEPN